MQDFIEIPASESSKSRRKLIHGVGVNDANYIISLSVNGKLKLCPYYSRWKSMIKRCYSNKYQKCRPTYKECRVSRDWLIFSNFKSWMANQDWHGMHLDKDIKVKGNKVYSPSTCLFIDSRLNTLFNDCRKSRGDQPIGVYLDKRKGVFSAHISNKGSIKTLGYFKTLEGASKAYQVARRAKIQNIIDNNTYPVATKYLGQYL